MSIRVGLIIPARNEETTIGKVLAMAREAVPHATIVVVDDASQDSTARVARQAGAVVLRMPCHVGYAEAVATGLEWAVRESLEVAVLLDGDLQHDPRDIPVLLEALEDAEADVAIGSRFIDETRDERPLRYRIGNRVFSVVIALLTGCRIHDTSSGFKALRSRVFPSLLSSHFVDFHAESIVLMFAAGFRIVEVPVKMADRSSGNSMHRWTSLFVYPPKTALTSLLNALKGKKGVENR